MNWYEDEQMQNNTALTTNNRTNSSTQVAPGVAYMTIVFVNLYMVGASRDSWILVDTGLAKSSARIRWAAEERYGSGARPRAIVLTHGHFDHAGSALDLAEFWDVPIYAHRLELPYLTGKSDYPPQDPTVGGTLALMSRLFPHTGYDFGDRVRAIPADGKLSEMPDWRMIHTPGHTAGHAALFREADRVLLAGDALATVNQDSAFGMVKGKPEFRRPPAPFTTDWEAAHRSVKHLAELRPTMVGAGHGVPVMGRDVATQLQSFAEHFTPPRSGRYVTRPARADEQGIVELPPPVPDRLPKVVAGAAIAVAAGTILTALIRRRR